MGWNESPDGNQDKDKDKDKDKDPWGRRGNKEIGRASCRERV